MANNHLKIFVDGACHNKRVDTDIHNHMGIGVCVILGTTELYDESRYGGLGTNNIAEYKALKRGLKAMDKLRNLLLESDFEIEKITIHCDSQIIVNQYNGEWMCRDEVLRKYLSSCLKLKYKYEYELKWIPRTENERADFLSKEELIRLGYRDSKGKVIKK